MISAEKILILSYISDISDNNEIVAESTSFIKNFDSYTENENVYSHGKFYKYL